MKNINLIPITLLLLFSLAVQGQNSRKTTGQTDLPPQVKTLQRQGWKIQHAVMAWDSLSMYVSALAPKGTSYDLYVLYPEGTQWGTPMNCRLP